MPVTPRGIVSPNDPDNWDLIVDLAAMGSSIDAAIGNSASGRPGTAAQRTAYTASAPNGFLWQDTDGAKLIWRKDGAVWVPAVWRWSGTTAQMTAFTTAPNGFEWFNTTTNSEYVRFSGVWASIPAPQLVTHSGALTVTGSGGTWIDAPSISLPSITVTVTSKVLVSLDLVGYCFAAGADNYGMIGVRASGATTVTAGQMTNGTADNQFGSFTPFTAVGSFVSGFKQIILNPGTTTLTVQIRKANALGTATVSYPGLRVTPLQLVA